jgi:tetratricopeptide (TPR) repeat protein
MSRAMRITCASILIASALCACSGAASRKASYLAHGRAYLASANYAKARIEFSNAAQIDPKDPEARFLLGQVAEKSGDARAALGNYQAAINIDPKKTRARAAMGRLYLYGGLAKEALKLVQPGLTLNPTDAQLLTVRGAARAQLGDASAALDDARRSVQLAPDDQYAIALLASLYKQRSEFDQATFVVQAGLARVPSSPDLHAILAELELAQQRPAEAEGQLQQIVQLEPRDLAHRYSLARFYLGQKRPDAAERTLRDAVANQPGSVDAKLQLVELLAAQRDADQAALQVARFFAAEPDNDPLRLTLGDFLSQNRHLEDAARAFRAVIAHAGDGPDGLAARDRLAAMLIARNDMRSASALIAEVLKHNVRDNDALILRAKMSLDQQQTQSAINDLRAVLRDRPDTVEVMRALAQAYQLNDERELAEQTLRAAVQISPADFRTRLDLAQAMIASGEFDQAEPLLEQLAKEDATNIPVKQSLFRALTALKRYDDARAVAEDIERVSPNRGLGFYLVGLANELDQKPEAAVRQYELALQHQPDVAEPLEAIIHLQMSRRQFAPAMTRIAAAIEREPRNPVAHNLRAELQMALGHPDAAITEYQQTVQLAPGWQQGYQGLALAQTAARRYEEAVGTLKAGIARTDSAAAPLIGELGRLYERLRRPDDAIALYESLLARSPTSVFARNNLAMLLVTYREDHKSLARAQALAEQLATSSDASAIDTRGWVKFKSGDWHGAESLLQQAVAKQPAEPELRYHLGMAQLRSGERQSAQQNLETALSLARPFIGMDEAKATLAQLKKATSLG